MRLTAPKRPGTPHALSGRGTTINLDQLTFDRLAWLGNTFRRLTKQEAGKSVLIRRAVAFYLDHIEALMVDPEALQEELPALRWAARGEPNALPEEELQAKTVRPFSEIRREAQEARGAAMRGDMLAPLPPMRGERQ